MDETERTSRIRKEKWIERKRWDEREKEWERKMGTNTHIDKDDGSVDRKDMENL